MHRNKVIISAARALALAFLWTHIAYGADSEPLPTVAFASRWDAQSVARYQEALRDALKELGYVDGKNVKIVVRYANGDPNAYKTIVTELVAQKVNVLMGDAPPLKEATSTIPIVSPIMSDPVRTGLVASLARPGGNLTGVAAQSFDIVPKQLELAKELVRNLRHVCILFDENGDPGMTAYIRGEYRDLAKKAGMTVCAIPVTNLDEIKAARKVIEKERPQAVQIWATPLTVQHRAIIVASVARGFPVYSEGREFAEAGALFGYSVDFLDLFRHSARYVDQILKGAKPGDLPIEQPTKFNLVVNLTTARALGIKVPHSVLTRADEVIR